MPGTNLLTQKVAIFGEAETKQNVPTLWDLSGAGKDSEERESDRSCVTETLFRCCIFHQRETEHVTIFSPFSGHRDRWSGDLSVLNKILTWLNVGFPQNKYDRHLIHNTLILWGTWMILDRLSPFLKSRLYIGLFPAATCSKWQKSLRFNIAQPLLT